MPNRTFAIALLLTGLTATAVRADPAPSADVAAKVRELLPQLDADDFRVRERAALVLKNLPGDAWPAVRDARGTPGLSAEARHSLETIGRILKARQLTESRSNDLVWNRESAVAAYDSAGRHNPKWDAAAREALRLYPRPAFDPRMRPKEDVARRQAFETANAAGCDDPLFLYCYARLLEEPGDDPVDRPRINELYRAASNAIVFSSYPAVRKCFAFARAEQWQAALDLLPAAAREPGVRASHVLALTWMCADGLARTSIRPEAYKAAQQAIDAALPGKLEPLLFKGECLARIAYESPAPLKVDPLAAPPPFPPPDPIAEAVAKAEAALREAYDLDPTDHRAATKMLALRVHPGGRRVFDDEEEGYVKRREDIELWYRRAMEANPDNYDACLLMLEYHQTDWRAAASGLQAVVRYGRACAAGGNFFGRIPFILAEAHLTAASASQNREAYLRDPAVWAEIRNLYESHLALFPDHDYYRSGYAKWAHDCQRWQEAKALFDGLAERGGPDLRIFGSQDGFEIVRDRVDAEAARLQREAQTQKAR